MASPTASIVTPGAVTRAAALRLPRLPDFAAGTLSALVTLSYSIGYGTMIFGGPDLQPHLASGLQAALMATWVLALAVALGSSLPFAIAGPDSNATAILAVMASGLAASLTQEGVAAGNTVATILMMLALSAIGAGSLVWILGACRRSRLVRFIPYPVVGGFLAGTGFLVAAGALKVLTGKDLGWDLLKALLLLPASAGATTGAVALALLLLPRFCRHYLVMPLTILGGVALFYLLLLGTGLAVEQARIEGLLFKPLAPASWPIPAGGAWGLVAWPALLGQWQNLLALTVVVVITILLNATGLELATGRDVDFDRELRVNGLANILAGVCGGMIGYVSISRSLLNYRAGASSRAAGIWTACLCMGVAFIFTPAVAYFPRPVLAGLLLYLGLSMLREWVWDAAFKLPRAEYGLIVLILLLIALHGLIFGVGFGVLVASILFVYSYSRTSSIRQEFTCANHASNKERALEQRDALKTLGLSARTLNLQGYLFFGTCSAIVDRCRVLVEGEKIRYLLLDFRMVQGLDASAVLSFSKLEQICAAHGVGLYFSGLAPEMERVLRQTKFLPRPGVMVFSDLDRALERVEDLLLGVVAGAIVDLDPTQPRDPALSLFSALSAEMDLRRILAAHFQPEALDMLVRYCETLKLPEGHVLFRKGDSWDGLYFIERGEVSVNLPLPDGKARRLRVFGPGTIVGEMALYLNQPRSADVVADMPCRVRRLSPENLRRLELEYPEAAIQFHAFVVKLMAARLLAANDELRTYL